MEARHSGEATSRSEWKAGKENRQGKEKTHTHNFHVIFRDPRRYSVVSLNASPCDVEQHMSEVLLMDET